MFCAMSESEDNEAIMAEREEEMSTIQAVFPELERDPVDPFSCFLELHVQPTIAFRISIPTKMGSMVDANQYPASSNEDAEDKLETESHDLSYLPSLRLNILLPGGYPYHAPPKLKLETRLPWLPATLIRKHEARSAQLWEEYGRVQILYVLIDHLQQAAEDGFGLDRNALNDAEDISTDLKLQLLDHDAQKKKEIFEKESFSCGICLEPKKGTACHRLERCRHVFCVDCLRDFYNNCINEGDVTNVKCLDPECGTSDEDEGGSKSAVGTKPSQKRMLHPKELLQIPLDIEVVRRYVKMRRKKVIESDKDTVFCPRKWCQGPAKSKKYPELKTPEDWPEYLDSTEVMTANTEPDVAETIENEIGGNRKTKKVKADERLAQCEDCKHAFCRVCKQGWHGDFQVCWPRDQAEIAEEERETLNYIRQHTTSCPTCATPCQKSMGCNHMQCFQCNTHFCYLCSAWLDPMFPYKHFSNKNLTCFEKLFEGVEGDEPGGFFLPELRDEIENIDEIIAN